MLEPSSGDCYVGNVNVAKNIDAARENLGLCPQHNILIRELTVKEHFEFFGELKGLSRKDAKAECFEISKEVQLEKKLDNLVYDISGGMQRKLMLGIALSGGSTYLILDEPSSGIDVRFKKRFNRKLFLQNHDAFKIHGSKFQI